MLAKVLDYYFKHAELFILICHSQKGANDPSSFFISQSLQHFYLYKTFVCLNKLSISQL